jgi:hypothetical protein
MIIKSLNVTVDIQFIYPTHMFFISAKIVMNITFIVVVVIPISKFPRSFRITSGLIRNQFNSSKSISSSNPGNKDFRQLGTTNPTSPHQEQTPFPGLLAISRGKHPAAQPHTDTHVIHSPQVILSGSPGTSHTSPPLLKMWVSKKLYIIFFAHPTHHPR